jgi:hypothetical protein
VRGDCRGRLTSAFKEVPMAYPLPLKIAGVGRYLQERRVRSTELEPWLGLPEDWITEFPKEGAPQ